MLVVKASSLHRRALSQTVGKQHQTDYPRRKLPNFIETESPLLLSDVSSRKSRGDVQPTILNGVFYVQSLTLLTLRVEPLILLSLRRIWTNESSAFSFLSQCHRLPSLPLHCLQPRTWRSCLLVSIWILTSNRPGSSVVHSGLTRLSTLSPRSIWRGIIQDQYVDFEKLFAALGPEYDHRDDPKEFTGGFALVHKEHALAKRPLKTEVDFLRVFAAWRTSVCLLYPHREAELSGYLKMVTDLFRAVAHDPMVAIRFDVQAWDRYAKSPYHMDDRGQHNISLLAQMFRPQTSSGGALKRPLAAGQTSGPSKRATVPCYNWNLGFCEDPCTNRRMHGTCSKRGKSHRAKDHEKCFSTLQAQRSKGPGGNNTEGNAGGTGPQAILTRRQANGAGSFPRHRRYPYA
ncbi:hypothetical protein MVEN_00101800 [Mycena venus]|uniref:Uncharacterized protein n=1 Tax=Mycena venus TaxID=2733690 RepID=A0A8H6Z7Q5_9AGAR|nr:hypothetical protein MVEN_00101800 [Mycena venus]